MNLRALWKKNAIPLSVAVLAIVALVVTVLVWKRKDTKKETYWYDYEDNDDDNDDDDDKDKKKKKKNKKKNKKNKKKKNDDDDDDSDDDDSDDDSDDGECSKDEIKAAKKLAKDFAMLGRWENDFYKEPESKCLSKTEVSKAFAKGIDEARSRYEGEENWAKRVETGKKCKYGQCYGILGTTKPCRAKDDPKKCCNDSDGTKGCVHEERSQRKFTDWTCPSGYFWSGSTERGKECVDKHGNTKGTEQRGKDKKSKKSAPAPGPSPSPSPSPSSPVAPGLAEQLSAGASPAPAPAPPPPPPAATPGGVPGATESQPVSSWGDYN